MEWNEIKDEVNKIRKIKYAIRNSSTGKYLCDVFGEVKVFDNPEEAKIYIQAKKLSSNFELVEYKE
jgi:hypothetical protein